MRPGATCAYAYTERMLSTETARWQAVMQDTYGTPALMLVSGQGCWVTDETGGRYLDLVGGIAVNALGHAHPAIVSAVSRQVATLGHTSNLAMNGPGLDLAARLAHLLAPAGGRARVFLCNSGAEANEAAFKVARLTGRRGMVAATGGFHGRTMGSLALTGQPAKADPFRPLPGDVTFVPYGDQQALAAAVDDTTAAVVLEPIQGEAGVVVPPAGYLEAARRITRDSGALLVLDEVQTGVGRTGRWFAHQDPDLGDAVPDVVTLAKGLGGGLPIGAMVTIGDAVPAFAPGGHGCTFGGNPICAAAALAVLDEVGSEGFLAGVRARGEQLRAGLAGRAGVADVRGAGLLVGVVLERPVAREVEAAGRDLGVLVNAAAPGVIRLAPPLVITAEEVDLGIGRVTAALSSVGSGGVS